MEDGKNSYHLPVYNIKAVSRLVGLLPVTLRAWERRYGLPVPRRGDQGYRLYSEYDLQTLRWIKSQLEAGLSISRAVEYLNELRTGGEDPAELLAEPLPQPTLNIQHLADQFQRALLTFNDRGAVELLRRAFTVYSVDTVLMEIMHPALVELGEAWHHGKIPIAVEHFATQFCIQHLSNLLASSAAPTRSGLIVAACAPGEYHQIGLLSLVVMLRWRGWDIKFLGPDLNLDRLAEALIPLQPKMLLISATIPQSALNLGSLTEVMEEFPAPKPVIVLGGRAFEHLRLPESLQVIYLDSSPLAMIATIENILQQHEQKAALPALSEYL